MELRNLISAAALFMGLVGASRHTPPVKRRASELSKSYDFIIAGGGAAGILPDFPCCPEDSVGGLEVNPSKA